MFRERQLTFGRYGHTLNHRQAISPDGGWAVYDTRNEDSHLSRAGAIEMVHLESGEIVTLYQTANQSEFGPGVGAASFHPKKPLVAFIHGLENCTSEKPYSAARRFGAIVDVSLPGRFFHAESRTVLTDDGVWTRPFGALSGGTHAHSWSPDGWLSFTYNDALLERRALLESPIRNQRTVGFMVPGSPVSTTPSQQVPGTYLSGSSPSFVDNQASNKKVPGTFHEAPGTVHQATPPFLVENRNREVPGTYLSQSTFLPQLWGGGDRVSIDADAECFSGVFGAFLAASICTEARNGSDDIEAAVEECWVGQGNHALAFLGAVRGESGELVNEIFVCDLPSAKDWNGTAVGPGSRTAMEASDLLKPVAGCVQRRLTHTLHRTFPGIQGPRSWLVSSSDGKFLFAPMRDERGVAQLCRIDASDGTIEQITDLEQSIEGQISLDPSGTVCNFICDQRICLIDLRSARIHWLTERSEHPLVGAIHFAGANRFVFNRYVGTDRERWLQVFIGEIGWTGSY